MSEFSGQIAIVTGASSGIGAATTLQLASAGIKVYAIARRAKRLEEISKRFPNHVIPVVQDITGDLTPLKELIDQHRIDILINNAGLALGRETFDKTKPEAISQMLSVNVQSLM